MNTRNHASSTVPQSDAAAAVLLALAGHPHSHECGPVEVAAVKPSLNLLGFHPHSHECGPVEVKSGWTNMPPVLTHSQL